MKNFYNNYEISLHNELWSTAFMGGFMTGAQWFKPAIFRQPFSQARREFEIGGNPLTYQDKNGDPQNLTIHTMHHQYKILSDFIKDGPNQLNPVDFNDDLTPYKYYGPSDAVAPNNIESYYLVSDDKMRAWGWIHNLDHYWGNNYISTTYHEAVGGNTSSIWDDVLDEGQEYDNCRSTTGTVHLDGFDPTGNTTYEILLQETFWGGSVISGINAPIVTHISGSGILSFEISLGCDSTDGDYGFLIYEHTIPHRMMEQEETVPIFDFKVKPTASHDEFNLSFNKVDDEIITITVYDIVGKIIFKEKISNNYVSLNFVDKLPGIYFINCNSKDGSKTKRIIKL